MKQIKLFDVVNLPEMEANALEVLRSGRIAGGSFVAAFEDGIARISGQEHVISTVDMTSAVSLALYLSGVRAGDEVLTTSFSCMATNAAIALCGAIPVWVDLLENSVEYDVVDLASKITDRTKAVIVYHIAGYPSAAAEIAGICKDKAIALIEDCNNALFAARDGKPVGSAADFSVYSFYPNRQINTSEGGALVCRSAEAASRARKLRRFGIDGTTFRNALGEINASSDIPEIGGAITMNNLCASLGCAQLSSAAARVEQARANVEKLAQGIQGLEGVKPLNVAAESAPAYWVWLLMVENRDALLAEMKAQGVQVSSLHQRNDTYTCFTQSGEKHIPNTLYLQQHILALPCGWWLESADLDSMLVSLRNAVNYVSSDR